VTRRLVLAALATAAGVGAASLVVASHGDAANPPFTWVDGSNLEAGTRTVVNLNDVGWVVTKPFDNDQLTLTRFDLSTGQAGSHPLFKVPDHYTTASLSASPDGGIWIGAGNVLAKFDTQSGEIRQFPVPEPATDAAPSDLNPIAGSVTGIAWDQAQKDVVYVRDGDHRLYHFNSTTGETSPAAIDLGILTTPRSQLSVVDGAAYVSGGNATSKVYDPVAVTVASDGAVQRVEGVVTLSRGSATDVRALKLDGSIATMSEQPGVSEHKLADGAVRPSNTALVVDAAGSVFVGGTNNGRYVINRVTAAGQDSSATVPVVTYAENPGITRLSEEQAPTEVAVNPAIVGLLPDNNGGVWVVSALGWQGSPDRKSAYPTFRHLKDFKSA
jgi:hypothetical protein